MVAAALSVARAFRAKTRLARIAQLGSSVASPNLLSFSRCIAFWLRERGSKIGFTLLLNALVVQPESYEPRA